MSINFKPTVDAIIEILCSIERPCLYQLAYEVMIEGAFDVARSTILDLADAGVLMVDPHASHMVVYGTTSCVLCGWYPKIGGQSHTGYQAGEHHSSYHIFTYIVSPDTLPEPEYHGVHSTENADRIPPF